MIVEQFLPSLHYGDAIGNSTLRFHHYLLKSGISSQIITYSVDENLEDQAILFNDYKERSDSVKILHYAIPSKLTEFFLKTKGKKVLIYHNITPSHFFVDYSEDLTRYGYDGRCQLKLLCDCVDVSIADSEYNARELVEMKFKNVNVFPIMIDLSEYLKPHSIPYYNLFKDERKNIIFVGRITPNKKIEDLIKLVFFYKKYLSPCIRLIIVGNVNTLSKYFYAVRDLASRFYLTSEDIIFTGHIPFNELLSVYKLGDIFVSLSEHEGFCLPLIESCFFQVPVIAYGAGAVPDTLDGAGIILTRKEYSVMASLVERVIGDKKINSDLKRMGKKRIEKYIKESNPEKMLSIIKA